MEVISFTEIQIKQYIKKIRPSEEIRDQVDVSYSFSNNIVEVFEIRPRWDDPKVKVKYPLVRIRNIKSKIFGEFIGWILMRSGFNINQILK